MRPTKAEETTTAPETPPVDLQAAYAALMRRNEELAALLAARDRVDPNVEVGTAEHLRDSLYAHGTAVPQDASAHTIDHLEQNWRNSFYFGTKRNEKLGIPNTHVAVLVRNPNKYADVEGISRPDELISKTDDAAFIVKKSPWDYGDLVTVAVPKSYVEERDRAAEVHREEYESGSTIQPGDERSAQAGFEGYVGKHEDYPDGRNPFKRSSAELRAEHQAHMMAGLIGPTSHLSYDEALSTFSKERIRADEDHYRAGSRHQSRTAEQMQALAGATSGSGTTFSTGGVGFGPQSRTERQQTVSAAARAAKR